MLTTSRSAQLLNRVSVCIGYVGSWMHFNRCNLTHWKPRFCGTHQLINCTRFQTMMMGLDTVQPVKFVRDLGIHFNSDLLIWMHVTRIVSSCFAVLCQIHSISQSVSWSVLHSLIVSLCCHFWTTAAQRYFAFLLVCWMGCSQSKYCSTAGLWVRH